MKSTIIVRSVEDSDFWREINFKKMIAKFSSK